MSGIVASIADDGQGHSTLAFIGRPEWRREERRACRAAQLDDRRAAREPSVPGADERASSTPRDGRVRAGGERARRLPPQQVVTWEALGRLTVRMPPSAGPQWWVAIGDWDGMRWTVEASTAEQGVEVGPAGNGSGAARSSGAIPTN